MAKMDDQGYDHEDKHFKDQEAEQLRKLREKMKQQEEQADPESAEDTAD